MRKREKAQLTEVLESLRDLHHESELLKTVLIVREPDTVTSVNAYEGLRKQIVALAGERRAHLTQLAQMDAMLQYTTDINALRSTSGQWLEQAGIERVTTVPQGAQLADLFDLVEQTGDHLVIREPAYVDVQSGRVLKLGRASLVARTDRRDTNQPGVADVDLVDDDSLEV